MNFKIILMKWTATKKKEKKQLLWTMKKEMKPSGLIFALYFNRTNLLRKFIFQFNLFKSEMNCH